MMATFFVLGLCLSGVLGYDVDSRSFNIDPPFVDPQRVVASTPLVFDALRASNEPGYVWQQVLSFDVEIEEKSQHLDSRGTRHHYAMQTVGGTPIWNAVGNLNVRPDGTLLESYQRFVKTPVVPTSLATAVGVNEALDAVREALSNSALSADQAQIVFVRDNHGHLRTAWHLYAMEGAPLHPAPTLNTNNAAEGSSAELTADAVRAALPEGAHVAYDHYWDVLIDANSLELLQLSDLVHRVNARTPFQYNVFAHPIKTPEDGSQSMQPEDFDETYSPIGWQDLGAVYGGYLATFTIGNNAWAMTSDFSTFGQSSGGKYNYVFDPNKEPELQVQMCLTQLFYVNNWLHDVFYQHGFDETSGNFQLNNFGRGGLEQDPIYAVCHANGVNNAVFMTLPDGQPSMMAMYLWDITSPKRDSGMDTGVVVHEYGHGVTNRLTGGGSTLCMGSTESGGLGEGWSDFLAMAVHTKAGDNRNMHHALGSYLMNNKNGVRRYPYTSDKSANPTDWSYYGSYSSSVHKLGEIWAIMLFEGYWNFIDEFGFNADIYNSDDGGNNLFLSLVIEGMKYQPCEPTFKHARDAIFAALADRHGDARTKRAQELLWAGFASRGFGESAMNGGVTSFAVPSDPTVIGSPSDSENSALAGGGSSAGADAVVAVLALIVVCLALTAAALVYRNWRLQHEVRHNKNIMSARTPLKSADGFSV